MKLDSILQKNIFVFAVLFSGVSFFGLYTKNSGIYSAIIAALVLLAVVFSCLWFLTRLLKNGNMRESKVLSLFGFFVCVMLYSFFALELSANLPFVSGEFEGGRFLKTFVFLSLILALYMGKRETSSLSRISIILLPFIILPYVLTFFDFVGKGFDFSQLIPEKAFSFDKKLFLYPICSFFGIIVLFPLTAEKGKAEKTPLCEMLPAFFAVAVFVFLEYLKYLLWFGKEGVLFVDRPDKTMLSQVPFMNVQELFIVSYYTAFMLKTSLFCTCARIYLEKLQKLCGIKKENSVRVSYCATAFVCFFAYLLSGMFKEARMMLIFAAFVLLFAVIILQHILKSGQKRPDMSENTPLFQKRN